jgi:uncharacterized membrane protein
MIVLALILVAILCLAERSFNRALESRAPLENFIALTLIHAVFYETLSEPLHPFFVFALLAVLGSARSRGYKPQGLLALLVPPMLAVYMWGFIVDQLLSGSGPAPVASLYWAGVALVFAGVLVYAGSRPRDTNAPGLRGLSTLQCWAGHGLAVAALFNLAAQFGGVAVSLAWGAYALFILIVGLVLTNAVLAQSSLVVLLVAVVKVFSYDLSESSSGVRIASLLVTGAVLYTSGYLFRRISAWSKPPAAV